MQLPRTGDLTQVAWRSGSTAMLVAVTQTIERNGKFGSWGGSSEEPEESRWPNGAPEQRGKREVDGLLLRGGL